jgi:hypothetical protein
MPVREEFIGGIEEWRETASATAGVATATRAAEASKKHYITGFSISASGTIAASVVAEIRQNGGATTRHAYQLPNSAIMPIIYEFKRVIEIPTNQSADINLPSLGGGITGRVELMGFTRYAT